jgi:hypothetical protein
MFKIFIAIPSSDNKIFSKCTQSLLNLCKYLDDHKILYSTNFYYGSLIPRIRNEIVSEFLKTNSSHLLFIDSDLYNYERYFDILFKKNVEVCGCTYPLKSYNADLISKNIQNKKINLFDSASLFNINLFNNNIPENINNIDSDGFLKVKHLPTGFLLIKDTTFLKLKNKVKKYLDSSNQWIYNYFDVRIYKDRYLSEDYSFSQLCVDNNINNYCYMESYIGHIGINNYKGNIRKVLSNYG